MGSLLLVPPGIVTNKEKHEPGDGYGRCGWAMGDKNASFCSQYQGEWRRDTGASVESREAGTVPASAAVPRSEAMRQEGGREDLWGLAGVRIPKQLRILLRPGQKHTVSSHLEQLGGWAGGSRWQRALPGLGRPVRQGVGEEAGSQCPQMARAFSWFQARRRRKGSDVVGHAFVFLLFFPIMLKVETQNSWGIVLLTQNPQMVPHLPHNLSFSSFSSSWTIWESLAWCPLASLSQSKDFLLPNQSIVIKNKKFKKKKERN